MISPNTKQHGREISLAILPFQQLSNDPEIELLARGFVESLRAQLERKHHISANSPQSPNTSQARRNQDIDFWIKGSLRVFGKQLRVRIQLIRNADQSLFFVKRYQGVLYEMENLQSQILSDIVLVLPH
ncbi:MAG: hypothetical protein AAFP02_26790 [Bacteroidota bacterium]